VQTTGHKTESIYRRYAIVDESNAPKDRGKARRLSTMPRAERPS